jgi:hypothetical protein
MCGDPAAISRMVEAPASSAAYFRGMDVVLRVLIIVIYLGLGLSVGSDSGSFADAAFWSVFVLVPLAGLLLFVWCFVGPLCTVRRAALRHTIRAVLVVAYSGLAIWGWFSAGSRYAREVAEYDPSAECRNLLGDCVPEDGRVAWLIFWALIGLVGVDAARRTGRKLDDEDGSIRSAEERVGQVSP